MCFSNQYGGERYSCPKCDRDYGSQKPSDTWVCPICKSKLFIYIDYNDNKWVIFRKLPHEIKQYDTVLLNNGYRYSVINKQENKDCFSVNLEGYGAIKFKKNQFVNCIEGSW